MRVDFTFHKTKQKERKKKIIKHSSSHPNTIRYNKRIKQISQRHTKWSFIKIVPTQEFVFRIPSRFIPINFLLFIYSFHLFSGDAIQDARRPNI